MSKRAKRTTRRGKQAQLAFEALSIEGGLLSPEWLSRIAQLNAGSQTEADYRIPKGLNLRDEIGRYWRIAQAHWTDFAKAREGKADPKIIAEHFVTSLLREAFDFKSLTSVGPVEISERKYPLGHGALDKRVPVVIAPAATGIDTLSPAFGDEGRRRSAFGLVQEYLNAAEGALWGIVTDGSVLRILRDNVSLTRPAWIEADLSRIFAEERYADFAALWLLLHESRFGREGQPATECALETWRNAGREEGTRAREYLRKGVEEALAALGQGFLSHPGNNQLRAALQDGSLSTRDYFSQLLRLVYRLIFLLTVEERNLLHPPNTADAVAKLYAQGYSLRRLAEKSVKRSAHDRFWDLWESVKVVLRGLAAGEPGLGLPALAGIFADSQCPALDGAQLENRSLLLAIFKLAWLREDGALARVNWRDMGPEELGSVYESLLELVPQISNASRQFSFASGDETKGNARKTSGSYYTPDSLVQVLLDSALEPVIADTIARNSLNPVEALLGLSIVDPACGSGHFLLAAARRLAAHVARLQANGTPSTTEYRHALRQVVSKCIYGVDLNPMAVELCKVSLWMEAVEPGLPLTFLNSHIQHGNALLGTTPGLIKKGIPDAAWEPIEGDDRATARALKRRNREGATGQRSFDTLWSAPSATEAQVITKAVTELEAAPDADATALARKESLWEDILGSDEYRHQKFVADAWCAAFVWPKQPGALAEAAPVNELWRQLRDGRGQASELTAKTVEDVSRQHKFFHWHLQFPQVFAAGGFDVLVGNPPWDSLLFQEQEFFAPVRPEIASAATAATRKRLISALETEAPGLFLAYRQKFREMDGKSSFVRAGVRYPLCGIGRVNLFALFAETALALVGPTGRVGQLLPSGIVSDDSTKQFFQHIVERNKLISFFDFENSAGLFHAVHRSFKFGILVLAGFLPEARNAEFAFFAADVADLSDRWRRFNLSPEDIALLNPITRTCPVFRTRRDSEMAKSIYRRVPVLKTSGWIAEVRRLLNSADDSTDFQPDKNADSLPVYEAKFFHHFDHRWATCREESYVSIWGAEKADPDLTVHPRHWYPKSKALARYSSLWPHSWVLTWRDIARSTDERTMIASVVPSIALQDNKAIFLLAEHLQVIPSLLASLSSFVFDFLARQKAGGTHLSAFIVEQLPTLRPDVFRRSLPWSIEHGISWVHGRVLELMYTAWDLEPFARDVGFDGPPFRWDPDRRFMLRCELDAAFFHLYSISREDTHYIMDTFPIVRKNDEKAHGEYRTKRVILEIYDEMAEAIRTGDPYQTHLDPPPASIRVAHPPRFTEERLKVDVGNYILSFVFAFLRYQRGECDVMLLARAYALMLQQKTAASLAEAEFGKAAREWVEKSDQALDGRWFLPILRKMDEREMVTLEVRGDDVFVRQKDPQGPPSNRSIETDVFLAIRLLDLAPAAALTTTTKTIVPKAPRVALQEAEVPA